MSKNHRQHRRILVVSRDLQKPDFTQHFADVMKVADQQKADTISFALFSSAESPTWDDLFGNNRHVKTVMLETGVMIKEDASQLVIQLWERHRKQPTLMTRQFARSSEPIDRKERFIRQFKSRVFGKLFCLICGELNIVSVKRPQYKLVDVFQFRKKLRSHGITTILNPLHTAFRRFELGIKRAKVASGDRTLVSVWNMDSERRGDLKTPWVVYRNGRKKPVREITWPIPARPDIRMGIVDVA